MSNSHGVIKKNRFAIFATIKVITQDIYKINTKTMYLCYKKFINLCQHANMSWLRHYQGRLMLFLGVTYITYIT